MAEWILVLAAIVQGVAAGIIAWFTIKLAAATNQYAETASDQVAAQFRPMLVPVDVPRDAKPFVPEESDTEVHPLRLVLENVGTGPALNAVAEILRRGPGLPMQPTRMLQFGQTRIGNAGPGQRVKPVVAIGPAVMFMDASNAAITDELIVEYEGLDGRCYQTHVTWRRGRWWDHRQVQVDSRSSQTVDEAEMKERSSIAGW